MNFTALAVLVYAVTLPPPQRFECIQTLGGAMNIYCYAPDGHIFRPRFPEFVIEVK